ncbi:inositol monophosphatase family protein [Chelatococcus asaccharovorans]|uniref:inositol monophosphatase family protein n=1 Tax=Chelatococcus asaccharovorans TaxID=28210 RepID=UPI00224C7287|nr:inositol monophosphatase family protein [Chelatococcus asaccharovorans]CAH1665225.1 Myo-inositol-1(Or 4)-monophosphatase [Chelatococcus asaccharovorans]CAH1682055.1 Myo-inositol-1(Or 4)-monophosphatase [Chelatococcus asaccharovorans]
MTDFQQRLGHAEQIVAACAEVALGHFRATKDLAVDFKGPRDFVSEADRQVETTAIELLAEHYPDEPLIGEEFGGHATGDYWLIDPIDGTTNFLNGLPLWGVSLAFVRNGEPVVGVIALPALDEVLSAAKTLGLRSTIDAALGLTSAECGLMGVGRNGRWAGDDRFRLEQALEASGLSVVCLGSCATSLAMVASGRMLGYVERSAKPWDVAAGIVLCEEAGIEIDARCENESVDIWAGRLVGKPR